MSLLYFIANELLDEVIHRCNHLPGGLPQQSRKDFKSVANAPIKEEPGERACGV